MRLRGYRIVGRNVRLAGREVDLLARRGPLLVVCEVKARRTPVRGTPLEAVGIYVPGDISSPQLELLILLDS